jgi:hypothetical protein
LKLAFHKLLWALALNAQFCIPVFNDKMLGINGSPRKFTVLLNFTLQVAIPYNVLDTAKIHHEPL